MKIEDLNYVNIMYHNFEVRKYTNTGKTQSLAAVTAYWLRTNTCVSMGGKARHAFCDEHEHS